MAVKSRFPFYSWAILFFSFLVLIRAWFFIRGFRFPETPNHEAYLLVLLAVLQDGFLVALFILPLQWLKKPFNRLSNLLSNSVLLALMLVASVGIIYSISNVEFFNRFGSHMNLDHIQNLTGSEEGFSKFVVEGRMLSLALLEWLLLPLIYIMLSTRLRFMKLDLFLSSRKGKIFIPVVIALGFGARQIPIEDPLKANFVENSIISFMRDTFFTDEIFNKEVGLIREVLDPKPLEGTGGKSQPWVFPDTRFPLMKATEYDLCQAGLKTEAECAVDHDKDGTPLADDCNDWDPRVHPGAADIPNDGIDQDCSGMDANPPNIIFIFWETARGVNIGNMGTSVDATPRFDAIVKKNGVLYRKAYANAPQTRWEVVPMYCSTYDRSSTKWILRYNKELNLLSWPEILKDRGYHTVYLHSGDLSISNISSRMGIWFQEFYDFHKAPVNQYPKVGWSITDKDLFKISWDFLTQGKLKPPFLFCIQTGSLHYPYLMPDEKLALADHKDLKNKISNLMHYSDFYLGEFLEKLYADPRFENTICLVAADHGINYFEPHKAWIQNMNYEDLVWIPIALIGKNWGVKPGVNDEIRQLVDIGPTILDRLGINVPNPFVGHSLLRSFGDRTARAFFQNSNGGLSTGLRENNWKFWTFFKTKKKYLFDLGADKGETKNLADAKENQKLVKRYTDMVQTISLENEKLIHNNKIYDPKYNVQPQEK